jgi:RNA polymerase sigma-70 factor (ECF subfamily)
MSESEKIHSLPGELGERALAARLHAGEAAACRAFYQTHAPRLLRLLLRLLRGERALAEEALQQAFAEAFAALARRPVESPAALLTAIAVRRGQNAARSERRRSASLAGQPEPPPVQPQPAERQAAARLLALIDALEEPKRTTLLLVAEGYTTAEIAAALGEPQGTILARIFRTRAWLAERARAEGLLDTPARREGQR